MNHCTNKKKSFTRGEVTAIFKDLRRMCQEEIDYHKNEIFADKRYNVSIEECKAFIDGIKQIKDYIIKQYYDTIIKDMEEGEFVSANSRWYTRDANYVNNKRKSK